MFSNVLVLGGLVIIAGLLTASAATSISSGRTASVFSNELAGGIAASSAVSRVVTAMGNSEDALDLAAAGKDGVIVEVGFLRGVVNVRSETGKIQLGLTDTAIVNRYFDSLSLDAGTRRALHHEASPGGEPARLFAAAYSYLLTSRSAEALADDFTTVGGHRGIDLGYASDTVLEAVPDLDVAELAIIEAARAEGRPVGPGLSTYQEAGPARFSIVATVRVGDTTVVKSVPVEITSSGSVLLLGPRP